MEHNSLPIKGLLIACAVVAGSSQPLLAEPPSPPPLPDWTARASQQLEHRIDQRMQQELFASVEEQLDQPRYAVQQPAVDPRVLDGDGMRLALDRE